MREIKLIADICGGSGAWSEDYLQAGYEVIIFDIKDGYDIRLPKVQQYIINLKPYGILAAPPCTQFSFAKTTGSARKAEVGMRTVISCLNIIWGCQYRLKGSYSKTTPLKFWALENPNGLLKHFLGNPPFEFNPYDFGDNYKKKTHLWGWFNEPKKTPIKCTKPKFDRLLTKEIHPEYYGKLTRQERRAITPAGFAKAFFEANR